MKTAEFMNEFFVRPIFNMAAGIPKAVRKIPEMIDWEDGLDNMKFTACLSTNLIAAIPMMFPATTVASVTLGCIEAFTAQGAPQYAPLIFTSLVFLEHYHNREIFTGKREGKDDCLYRKIGVLGRAEKVSNAINTFYYGEEMAKKYKLGPN